MQFFIEGWGIGLFHLPFTGEMPIPIIIWCFILSVAGVQLMLCRCRVFALRYSVLFGSSALFLACLVLSEIETGWELLGWLIVGGIFFAMLIGSCIGILINKFINKVKR